MTPAQLLPQVYDELRKLAAAKMAGERDGHTLDATALVNEAWLKLDGDSFASRTDFIKAAAVAMRRILVDHARAKNADKRGGGERVDLWPEQIFSGPTPPDVIDIDAAMAEFATIDPQAAELVHLRYFAGLSHAEAAALLGVSVRTADRIWVYAKSWLLVKLSGEFLA